ncbi:MAG: FeoA family protein [Desulfomonilaceae bacterium]
MNRAPSQEQCSDCPALAGKECCVNNLVKLSNLKPGQKGTIAQVCGNPDFRLRMMEMGFTKGTEVMVVKYAPLSDPVELVIKGYHITLRKDQASDILIREPDQAAA